MWVNKCFLFTGFNGEPTLNNSFAFPVQSNEFINTTTNDYSNDVLLTKESHSVGVVDLPMNTGKLLSSINCNDRRTNLNSCGGLCTVANKDLAERLRVFCLFFSS